MTTTPLVSLLTPVYNGERYLADCIESVLRQTYRHFEYVIVDNASTDRTADIIAAYAAREPRIRVHRNTDLVPVVANHNIALRHASPRRHGASSCRRTTCSFPSAWRRWSRWRASTRVRG